MRALEDERPGVDRRRSLLVTVLIVQAAVLLIGWTIAAHHVAFQLEPTLAAEARLRDVAQAEKVLGEIRGEQGPGSIERVQELVERLEVSDEAFACLVSWDGRILAHPQMRLNPGMRTMEPEAISFVPMGTRGPAPLRSLPAREATSGRVRFPFSGERSVAAAPVPELGGVLMVQRSRTRPVPFRPWGSTPLLVATAASGAAVLGLTCLSFTLVVRRYRHRLEAVNRRLERQVRIRVEQAVGARDALIFGLARLADYRDNDTGTHLERIQAYAELLAHGLRERLPERYGSISDEWIARLKLASSLHDIGKVGIPDAILLKPGPLTPGERCLMEQHALIGGDTLLAIRRKMGSDPLIDTAIEIALHHHERWDGQGYPFGIAGAEISLAGRIVGLADFYDAITSRRPYKEAMPHEQAVAMIAERRGTHFDPDIVDVFLSLADAFDRVRRRLHGAEDARGPRLAEMAQKLHDAEAGETGAARAA